MVIYIWVGWTRLELIDLVEWDIVVVRILFGISEEFLIAIVLAFGIFSWVYIADTLSTTSSFGTRRLISACLRLQRPRWRPRTKRAAPKEIPSQRQHRLFVPPTQQTHHSITLPHPRKQSTPRASMQHIIITRCRSSSLEPVGARFGMPTIKARI